MATDDVASPPPRPSAELPGLQSQHRTYGSTNTTTPGSHANGRGGELTPVASRASTPERLEVGGDEPPRHQEIESDSGAQDEPKPKPKLKRQKSSFGAKSLGFWSSCCLNLNNCMGPAMVLLPLVAQQAGWFTPTLALLVVFIFSTFAGTMLCEAMQRIPGNHGFNAVPRIEFTTTVRHYYGRYAYYVFQVLYTVSLQALNVASMIISAQVVDNFIFKITGENYALNYGSWTIVTACTQYAPDNSATCLESSNIFPATTVISLGFIVSMLICLPFGYLNLDDNMWFQWFSLVGLMIFTLEFVVQFFMNIVPGSKYHIEAHYDAKVGYNRTALGPDLLPVFSLGGQGYVFGLSTFAYSYIVTIPSWVNEKKPEVSVNKAVWVPALVGLVMKLAIGLLGGMSFYLLGKNQKPMNGADNILIELLHPRMPSVTQYSAYLWNLTTLIPGIPVLGIYVRYNLLSGKVCGPVQSAFWGVVAPWIVTIFLYEQQALLQVCNWIALLAAGFTNFVAPAMLYYRALKWYPSSAERARRRSQSGERTPASDLSAEEERLLHADASAIMDSQECFSNQARVNAVPEWLKIRPNILALLIGIFFAIFSVITIGFYIYGAVALGSSD